jgi:large subunit ribosomal protein L18
MAQAKLSRRKRIHFRIRKSITGTSTRPRLSVFRSNSQIYAQLVDDSKGLTLVSASSSAKDFKVEGTKSDVARQVGANLAKLALEKGLENVVFDRSGYLYHGRVKALAEGARDGGLKF